MNALINRVEAAFFREDDLVATIEESLISQSVAKGITSRNSVMKGGAGSVVTTQSAQS